MNLERRQNLNQVRPVLNIDLFKINPFFLRIINALSNLQAMLTLNKSMQFFSHIFHLQRACPERGSASHQGRTQQSSCLCVYQECTLTRGSLLKLLFQGLGPINVPFLDLIEADVFLFLTLHFQGLPQLEVVIFQVITILEECTSIVFRQAKANLDSHI